MKHNVFYEEATGIFRLRIPFETLYTSVFLIETNDAKILVDCGTSAKDVDEQIVPALRARGLALLSIDMLILTHKHSDHAGGLARILALAPHIKIKKEVCHLTGSISTYPLEGHTKDCIGVLDEKSGTLITGDALQGAGIDKYRCFTEDPDAYLATVARIQTDERINTLLFSHAYEPFYADRITGRKAVLECLMKCTEYVRR